MKQYIVLRLNQVVRLVFSLGLLCVGGISASTASAQNAVPRAMMQQLSRQLHSDSPAMRDCDTKTEFNFSARAVDLNGDKQPEYLLTSASACECGQVNCSQWVYRAQDQSLELLLEAEGYALNVRLASHKGFRDLATTSRGNAAILDHVSYTFDGKHYAPASRTIENLETHEIKPTEQPIRFAKGASTALVTGSASLAFPDSWTFAAKRGQLLTLVLERTSGAVATFSLVGPTVDGGHLVADSQVKWNNRLPADGLYTILVDAKGDGRAKYALTVSIR